MENLQDIIIQVKDGQLDAIEIYGELKMRVKDLTSAINEIEPIVYEEAEKHGTEFTHKGLQYRLRKGATRYTFNHIPEHQQMTKQLKDYEQLIKQATIAQGKITNHTPDGEEIPLARVTVAKDSIVVSKT